MGFLMLYIEEIQQYQVKLNKTELNKKFTATAGSAITLKIKKHILILLVLNIFLRRLISL